MSTKMPNKFQRWYFALSMFKKILYGFFVLAAIGTAIAIVALIGIAPVNADSMIYIYIIGGCLLLMYFFTVFLAKKISRVFALPLQMLAISTAQLAEGDVNADYSFFIHSQDEIGKLATMSQNVTKNIGEHAETLRRISDGDLTAKVTVRSDNDLLGKSLMEHVETLNALVSAIIATSDQVFSGSLMLSDSSSALSQGATEQASSVQQLNASLEEIAAQTHRNAQNAENANNFAMKAKEYAANGNTQMKEMLDAMEAINVSSGNINKIIKVIDDIAFQTNILALNAAVEAARAGQHGKGFAVVADEVRTLAARSANAAKETTDLIESSIRKIESGARIADATAQALTQISEVVDKAAELVHSIAQDSIGQAHGIEQISAGISQVSHVVQTNAATAEESAAASEELSEQAEQLRQTVGLFKIKSILSNQPKTGKILELANR